MEYGCEATDLRGRVQSSLGKCRFWSQEAQALFLISKVLF